MTKISQYYAGGGIKEKVYRKSVKFSALIQWCA